MLLFQITDHLLNLVNYWDYQNYTDQSRGIQLFVLKCYEFFRPFQG